MQFVGVCVLDGGQEQVWGKCVVGDFYEIYLVVFELYECCIEIGWVVYFDCVFLDWFDVFDFGVGGE